MGAERVKVNVAKQHSSGFGLWLENDLHNTMRTTCGFPPEYQAPHSIITTRARFWDLAEKNNFSSREKRCKFHTVW